MSISEHGAAEFSESQGQRPAGDWAWSEQAPAGLREIIAESKPTRQWRIWSKHLTRRRGARELAREFDVEDCPLAFGLDENLAADATQAWSECRQAVDDAAELASITAWLDEPVAVASRLQALAALSWGQALPKLAATAGQETWFRVVDKLVSMCNAALSAPPAPDPLIWLWTCGELPITLAYVLPELEPCRALAARGRESLASAWQELCDAQGMVAWRHVPQMRAMLACWTRCRWMLDEMRPALPSPWPDDAFDALLLASARWTRQSGAPLLAPDGETETTDEPLFLAAARLADHRRTRRLVRNVVASWTTGERVKASRRDSPAMQSDQAEFALLRSDWSASAPRLGVSWADRSHQVELCVGRDILFSGAAMPQVTVDGQAIELTDDVEATCWQSDRDMDYLELRFPLANGASVERHFMLARADQFLFVADAVFLPEPGKIQARLPFALGPGVEFEPEKETREGLLRGGKVRGRVMPLGLPEWRGGAPCGELCRQGDELALVQSGAGRALFAPLFFDLAVARRKKPFTWRQLTVAEDREIQPADAAVGYRVQIGKRHWLFYRSLNGGGHSRSVLSHHLVSEFLIARFLGDATVEQLLEIE